MKRKMSALYAAVAALALLSPLSVFADELAPPVEEKGLGLALRLDYLDRQSSVEEEGYGRVQLGWRSGNPFLNPCGGIEWRMEDTQIRSYWIGGDIIISDRTSLSLRLNHLEYGDWKTAINHANFYFSFNYAWFHGAVGMGYAALVFEDKYYRDPWRYSSEAPESRIIYNLSARPTLWKDRLELGFGLRNFDNFEYHGADCNGYHFEPIIHLTENTDLIGFYERRYGGLFISVPTLSRVTWMISLEHRF